MQTEPQQDTAFPIAGIGASAGGLEAVTELVRTLPSSTGMAFVVVQHLDPHHESILAELLARHTTMQVAQAVHGTTVLPNHIYVIPPNTQMTIGQGILLLNPRPKGHGPNLPIDAFLSSLAQERGTGSIGIILSGTASDGTIGLKSIKSEGGITFAQDDTARFDGMPRSAIAAGAVDFVLPPAAIANELTVISRHSHFDGRANGGLVPDGPPLQKILALLREQTNVDFVHYKTPTVQRRLSRRLALHNMDKLEPYLDLLHEKPDEIQALFDDLLINVTGFFRDAATFETLPRQVLPALLADRGDDETIRVWVPGCSSGEEVYSIAICLLEYLQAARRSIPIQIFGTDISERSIHTARTAKYPEGIAESVSPERLRRFFLKQETGYQVGRQLRDICVFSRQDVSKDPPLSRMDLISCRNLLIYLGPVLQKRVMAIFNYSLKPNGFLVLGSSETAGPLANHLVTVDREHKIYRRNMQLAPPDFELPGSLPGHRGAPQTYRPSAPAEAGVLDRKADNLISAEYGPSGFLVSESHKVIKFRGSVGAYLAPHSGDATLDVLSLVREELVHPLRVALEEARRRNIVVRRDRIRIGSSPEPTTVNLIVRLISEPDQERHFLVLIEDASSETQSEAQKSASSNGEEPASDAETESQLSRELASTRAYMQSLVEELRSANEEAQSSNEELQSTNEELQTSKEELQSANEELTTINDEMRGRNSELSQLNNDLTNLLSSMQVPVVMLNSELRIRRFTPTAEKALNLIATDVGRPISDLKPRVQVPDLEQLLLNAIRVSEPVEREVQDQDGHWHSLRIQPYRTAESRVDGAVLQLLDIDQLKRTLESAEHAREYAEGILATVREPLVVLDNNLRVQTANRSFFETFRVSPEETLNCAIYDLGRGQWDLPKVHQMLDSVLPDSPGMVENVEIEHEFERIGWRVFELNARRVRREGDTGLILLAMQDISDRKRAAEAKYLRLFETAKDGILILDGETGEITDANPFVLELFGLRREQLIGKPFWEAEPMDQIQGGASALNRLQTGEIVRFPDLPLRCVNGKNLDCEIVGNIYEEGDKRVIQFNIRDITDRKQFENQLQQTAKLESLGLLAGGIAHDFNNLLTGIMGNASLALTHAEPGSRYQNELKEVVLASQRAAGLTRQMLAYAGKGRFVVRPVNLSELVKDISALVRASVPRNVELKMTLGERLPLFQADATEVQQVIMNLVINGAEAIPENESGTVRVTTGLEHLNADQLRRDFPAFELPPASYVFLEVKDNGSGMDEATRAKIFDPFFTTKFYGRGLGLAAVQGIVRGHHGAIRVVTAPGRGTAFKVIFPVSEVAAPEAQVVPASVDLRGTGLVLLVDDEDIVLRMARPMLQHYGYQVLTAVNGKIAADIVRERGEEVRLVILDLTMPVMGGEEAFDIVRSLRPDLPIILSSGYDQAQAASRFGDKDLAGFLQKPYTLQMLLEIVKGALDSTG